ncbi:MAG: phage baseplate assembly protein V [Oscillospiraceae bacterium]
MSFFDQLLENDESKERRIFGITTGKVVENWEKKHPGMVKVELFMGEPGKNRTDWAPVAQPYAGKEYGSYFLPEVGDEVVLAFNMGDQDHPIIIGSLWNQVNVPPADTAAEKNDIKRLKTKGGHELLFTEESGKETLTLHTPGGLTMKMEDDPQTILVQDKDGKNLVKIDGKNGAITATAGKKIILDVGGSEFTLDGQGKKATLKINNINIEANQSLTLKGQNVKIEGSMIKINASGNLDANANGILSVKGSMAKIN